MKYISIMSGQKIIVDNEDFELLSKYKWHLVGEKRNYVAASLFRKGQSPKNLLIHRLIMNAKSGQIVDHVNGNRFDNRKENLRFCSATQNAQNRRKAKNKTSKYKGVTWWKSQKSWTAQIMANYKIHFLGYFDTEKEAAISYNKAALKIHGDYAYLNKI